jgi:hypothetical protein
MRSSALSAAALTLLLLAGAATCGGDEPSPAGEPPPGSAPGVSPVSPISTRDSVPPPGAPGLGAEAPSGDPIQWALPAGWQAEPPTNSMRLAQASVPGAAGAAELSIFHFAPGAGGGLQDNLDRWIGQMGSPADPEGGSFESGPFQITWVSAPGTYDPGAMGMQASPPQPGWRLLGAVVEGEDGRWFFKLVGPEATVSAAREDFFTLLRSIRPTA